MYPVRLQPFKQVIGFNITGKRMDGNATCAISALTRVSPPVDRSSCNVLIAFLPAVLRAVHENEASLVNTMEILRVPYFNKQTIYLLHMWVIGRDYCDQCKEKIMAFLDSLPMHTTNIPVPVTNYEAPHN